MLGRCLGPRAGRSEGAGRTRTRSTTHAPGAPMHLVHPHPAPDAPIPLHQMQGTPAPDAHQLPIELPREEEEEEEEEEAPPPPLPETVRLDGWERPGDLPWLRRAWRDAVEAATAAPAASTSYPDQEDALTSLWRTAGRDGPAFASWLIEQVGLCTDDARREGRRPPNPVRFVGWLLQPAPAAAPQRSLRAVSPPPRHSRPQKALP